MNSKNGFNRDLNKKGALSDLDPGSQYLYMTGHLDMEDLHGVIFLNPNITSKLLARSNLKILIASCSVMVEELLNQIIWEVWGDFKCWGCQTDALTIDVFG